jgi:peptidoglycan/LPS O-acetylase OafA/YrhL
MKDESANLDVLRSAAVALVVVSHIPHFVDWPALPFSFDAFGRFGVAIFFVHTTIVLMQSLERHGHGAVPFLVRRFFRLYPLSVAIVLMHAGLLALAGSPVSWANLVSNLLLIQNLTDQMPAPSPLWSLPYEVQMYLALPALYGLARADNASAKVALLWVASLAVAASGIAPLLIYTPCFLSGVLAYTLRHRRAVLPASVLFAAVAVGAVLMGIAVAQGMKETPLFWLACPLLGLLVAHCREIRAGWITTAAKTVARYSYGVYLTHWYALGLMLAFPSPLRWIVFAMLLAGMPVLAYRAIERTGIEFGARLALALTYRRTPAAARYVANAQSFAGEPEDFLPASAVLDHAIDLHAQTIMASDGLAQEPRGS